MGSTAAAPVPRAAARDRAGPRPPPGGWRQPVLVGIVAALLASAWSWHVSLWTDEAATISATTRPLPELWAMLGRVDAVHGLWYAAMHPWVAVAGTGPVALRLPSAVGAGVTAAGVAVLAGRLLVDRGRRAPLLAGLVAAGLPRLTWAGIEARPYVWTAAAAVWLTVLLHAAAHRSGRIRRRGSGWWAGYAVAVGFAVSLNVYLALVVVGHGVAVLLDRSVGARRRLAWLAAAAVGALLSAPVVVVAAGQTGQLGRTEPGAAALVRQVLVNQYLLGETPSGSATGTPTLTDLAPADAWAPASVALALVAWLLVALGVAARVRAGAPAPLAWTVPWIVVPTLVLALPALAGSPVYSPRYLTCTAPAFALLAADGLTRLAAGRRTIRAGAAAVALLVLLAAPVYVSQRYLTAKSGNDWSEVAAVLTRHRPGDAVYFTPRRPATDPPYRQTTRPAEIAYPAAYRGTTDPTLLASAAGADDVFPTSRPLADSLSRLDGAGAVWVLRRTDAPPTEAAADAALLARAGFRPDPAGPVFTGPLTVVTRYAR